MKSIICKNKECYICKSTMNLEDHHIFFGANRKLSEKYGLKVYLCYTHHRGTYGVHGKEGNELNQQLKKIAQSKFEETHSRQEFINIFGKNYLG